MAGIGFSLRRLAGYQSYTGMLRLYGAASLISCGPWLLSVMTLLLIGVLGKLLTSDTEAIERFQVCVTWLLGSSLVLSGPLQLQLTRFVSDRSYLGQTNEVASNLLGAMISISGLGVLVAVVTSYWFEEESLMLRLVLGAGFITLLNNWLLMSILGGLRRHHRVLQSFAIGYLVTLVGCPLLLPYGEAGLLLAFALGQSCLLLFGLRSILSELPLTNVVAWSFLRRRALHVDLLWVGLLYNLGIWIDKLLFWGNAETSRPVIGIFRASDVYDLPVFLAYLTIVPGMAVFLIKVETDFAEHHAKFYEAVRTGESLSVLEPLRDRVTSSVRSALAAIGKVQTLSLLACLWFGPLVLQWLDISSLHLPVFYINALGVSLQVLLLAVISVFFYLDRKHLVTRLTLLFLVLNAGGTWLSHQLGPDFYGMGFGLATGITSVVALAILNRTLTTLVRDTFILQPVRAR